MSESLDTSEAVALDDVAKARIYDDLTRRVAIVQALYDAPRGGSTFNSVFSNGVLAGLRIVSNAFDIADDFPLDTPHPLTGVDHLIDDRTVSRVATLADVAKARAWDELRTLMTRQVLFDDILVKHRKSLGIEQGEG